MHKETEYLLHAAQRRGWSLISQRRHYKLRHQNGRIVVFPKTPSDVRSILNTLAILRHLERMPPGA